MLSKFNFYNIKIFKYFKDMGFWGFGVEEGRSNLR